MKRYMQTRAPGSAREPELVRAREMVLSRGRFSPAPECVREREMAGTERVLVPFAADAE
jgi:hypothetical protein